MWILYRPLGIGNSFLDEDTSDANWLDVGDWEDYLNRLAAGKRLG